MNLLVALRLVSITVFTLFSIVILSTAAWNISVINPNDTFHVSMDAFVISISAIAVLFILPLIAYDFVEPNAFVSKVWFEITWLSLFWVFYLAGASALTAAAPEPICSPKNFLACTSAQVLLAFLWLLVTTVLIHLLILSISAIYYSKEHPHVWFATVREFRWFEGGGGGTPTVTPLPNSPVAKGFKPKRFSLQAAPVAPLHPYRDAQPLERVAEAHGMTASQWIRHQALQQGERRGVSEVSTRPPAMAHAPSYRPAHYTAVTSTRIDGQAQQIRRSSRDNNNNNPPVNMYPTAMNKALDPRSHYRQSSREAVIPPAPQLNNALGLQTQPSAPPPPPSQSHRQRQPSIPQAEGFSTYYSSQRSSREPPPIRDWPRPNPQEPLRKNSYKNVAPPYAPPPPNPISIRTHRVADSSAAPERVARRTSSQDSSYGSHAYREPAARPAGPRPPRPQRHRPPPLDLTRALPARR